MNRPLDGRDGSSDSELTQASEATAPSKGHHLPPPPISGRSGMNSVSLADWWPVPAGGVGGHRWNGHRAGGAVRCERQALVMDHPAIARVFDGGATPQGRPYFVMEYVRGEAITAYCQRHKLSIRDRIDLFLQSCDGVQHAHQKGIIHRDLKPSNILVTIQDDRPVPKIIDFGVAKATTQQLTEHPLYTQLGVLIGTPEYMSPEQAEMTDWTSTPDETSMRWASSCTSC